MPNKILPAWSASGVALAITVAGLPSSTSGVGRQSTMVDNSVTRYQLIRLFILLTQGISPVGNKAAYIYALRGDKAAVNPYRSDGAGATDAAIMIKNAKLLEVIGNASSPSNGDPLFKEIIFKNPGPEWGIALYHDTGVNLDATAGNHYIRWIGENPEVQ